MDINFELYKVFYFTARAKSISSAAKELYISQPAVSQSIKQLEEKLGGRLFFRTPKGIMLTAEGETLYKYIEQAYNFIITAQGKFADMQNLNSGEIRIGASDTICKYYLLPYLESFHEKYPNVRIQVTNRTTDETIKLMESGKVDFGIVNLPIVENNHIEVKKGAELQDCFVAGEKYKWLSQQKIHLSELISHPMLLLENCSITRQFIDKYVLSNGLILTPSIELGSIDLLVEFAKIGLGISCVIKNFIQDELENSKLYEIKLLEEIPKRNIGTVFLKGVPISSAAKKFIELLH